MSFNLLYFIGRFKDLFISFTSFQFNYVYECVLTTSYVSLHVKLLVLQLVQLEYLVVSFFKFFFSALIRYIIITMPFGKRKRSSAQSVKDRHVKCVKVNVRVATISQSNSALLMTQPVPSDKAQVRYFIIIKCICFKYYNNICMHIS
jgi:hypothetical protein